MTTAHRPTFDPARGAELRRGPTSHAKPLPAYTTLKFRKRGQGGDGDIGSHDLRAELLAAEAAHSAKLKGLPLTGDDDDADAETSISQINKRSNGGPTADADDDEESPGAKRRKILKETRDIDADDSDSEGDKDSDASEGDDDDDDSSDDEDEEELLQRELERVKREKAEKREKEEREKAAAEQDAKERDIALGNPLLNKPDFNIKRRWDDDVVFKNQGRGTEEKGKSKEFINDMLRSDFHRRFMSKYVN